MALFTLLKRYSGHSPQKVSPHRKRSLRVEALEVRQLLSLGSPVTVSPACTMEKIGFDQDTSQFAARADATPAGASYLLWENWGGTWCDAEKSSTNTEDDLLCWAAAASNVLAWTGWGQVHSLTNTDQIFAYFQKHWTDQGGLMGLGWDWWFDGTNNSQGRNGWSQEDVQGGGFYTSESFSNYVHASSDKPLALKTINQHLHSGYGVSLAIYTGDGGGHAITCWGINYNPNNPSEYLGLWITDSDDDKGATNAPDNLHYYEVEYVGDRWFLQDYYYSDSWYIGLVTSLDRAPASLTVNAGSAANNGAADTIAVSTNADGVARVVVNGSSVRTVPAASLKKLTINGSNDVDTIDLASLTGVATGFTSIINGGGNADKITGSVYNDTLIGGAGNDTLIGGTGNDRLVGGAGNDRLYGGYGNDTYAMDCDTSLGADVITDNGGIDTLDFSTTTTTGVTVSLSSTAQQKINSKLTLSLNTGTGIEDVIGTPRNDVITGNALANILRGGDGDDRLYGKDGNDQLSGGDGNDQLYGGNGDDTYVMDCDTPLGADIINDDGGTDSLDFSATTTIGIAVNLSKTAQQKINSNLTLSLNTGAEIEGVTGTPRNDIIIGNALANTLCGGDGHDILFGMAGRDTLIGGKGRDILFGGSGADELRGGKGSDILLGGKTTYCNENTGTVNRTALNAILKEWTSAGDYATRVKNIQKGGGANGSWKLDTDTLRQDAAVDTLHGKVGNDWFLADGKDKTPATT